MGAVRLKSLNGGLDTRETPLRVDVASMKGQMYSPALKNCDMFYTGGIAKRRGKSKQGASLVTPTVWASQTSTGAATTATSTDVGVISAICQKIVAGSTATISTVTVQGSGAYSASLRVSIKSDSGGNPGSNITNGVSPIISYSGPGNHIFYYVNLPVLTSGVTYWICVESIVVSSSAQTNIVLVSTGTGSSGRVKKTLNNFSTFSTDTADDIYYSISSVGSADVVQGIYDYRFGSSSTQKQMASVGGALYWNSAGTWTSLTSSLGSGQNILWDYETFRDYLFSTDYGTNIPRAWEGSSTGTMKLGYRLTPWYTANYTSLDIDTISNSTITMDASQAANGLYVGKTIYLAGSATLSPQVVTIKSYATTGTVGQATYYVTSIIVNEKIYTDHTTVRFNGATVALNSASGSINTTAPLTCFSILQVTSLKSGGFRAAEFSADTEATNTGQIEFTNVKMDTSTDGTEYGFDIASKATTWYMTAAFDPTVGNNGVYYKIPTANMSTGNPTANSDEAFNITTVANLTTSTTLLDDYGLEQEYFTFQIDAPLGKFIVLYQGMLVMDGGAANPNTFFYSEQNAPNIWSEFGELLGGFEEINTNDGQILTGLSVWNGNLYLGKRRKVFLSEFTYNNSVPFAIRELEGSFGMLSHFSSVSISGLGLVFMSENGPSVCTGTTVRLLPGAERILDRFEPNSSTRYNLSSMVYTTVGHISTKKQIHWGVSSTSATTRDITLVYDYENQAFWENDVSANYYATVTDSSFFPFVWSGDYSAQVFKMDTGTSDNGSAIDWYFDTPNMNFGEPFKQQRIQSLFVAGNVQSSGTLSVDIYLNNSSTVLKTITYDMSLDNFASGIMRPLGLTFSGSMRLRLRNSQLDIPCQINAIGLDYTNIGAMSGQA